MPSNPGNRNPNDYTVKRSGANSAGNGSKKKRQKSKFALFYIVTLLAGIAVCMVLFVIAFQTITQNNPPIEGSIKPTGTHISTLKDYDSAMGMLVSKDNTSKTVTLLDLASGRKTDYTASDATVYTNRYGSPMTFAEYSVGQIVEMQFETETRELASISISTLAWEYTYITNIKVDTDNATVTVGNDVYKYNSQTLVFYQNEPYSISRIRPLDTITMIGYQDNVWCIWLDNSHGYIRFENADLIVDGYVTIGASVYSSLENADPIAVAEDTHRVVVQGANIEPFVEHVTVRVGETVTIDLQDVEIRESLLRITVNEPFCDIIIDGVVMAFDGPFPLPYGTHTVRVEKQGFIPVEQVINLNRQTAEIRIEMLKEISGGYITIETTPTNAQIYIDGAFVGFSPLTCEAEFGLRVVIARMAGYRDAVSNFNISERNNGPFYMVLYEDLTGSFQTFPPIMDDVEPLF